MKINKGCFLLAFLVVSMFINSSELHAEVRLPKILGSNMVVQRGQDIHVWGWADAKEKVSVTFNGKTLKTKANSEGNWSLYFSAMKAGGPYEMLVQGKSNNIKLENILVGDVWVCSGQSNMEWMLQNTNNAEEEISLANYPEIRLFDVPRNLQFGPVDDLPSGEWSACNPESVKNFSAVGYFFGRYIHKEMGVPIGLVGSNWGGTVVETWISRETASKDPQMKEQIKDLLGIDIKELNRKKEEERQKFLAGLGELGIGIVDGRAVWAEPDIDMSQWKEMPLPGLWEGLGLAGLDGVIWFRKSFELSEAQAKAGITLHLNKIDDSDQTYINGDKIGETINAYATDRIYKVAPQFLKEGVNTIAVRVEDTGGGGGIYGAPDAFKVVTTDGAINLAGLWKYRISSAGFSLGEMGGVGPNDKPTLLYNGMINPIIQFPVRGAIWYQGESNTYNAQTYKKRFPAMIMDWREKWNNPDLDFYFVQLANYMEEVDVPGESTWAELREAQTMTLNTPGTGMAVIIDIGEAGDIHPRNKQDVGKRLALAALHETYGKELVYSAPVFREMKVEGSKAELSFDMMGSELIVDDKYGYVKGFSIAGADKKFYWAKGILKDGKIYLWSEYVKEPVAVRYAWADNPEDANLFNTEGLPVGPFRTDDWPGITY